jgi:fatty-acid desaturase
LAVLSMGESWHNGHHAMPGCARHGVLRAQLDISANVIACFEKVGWATDVNWPKDSARRRRSGRYEPVTSKPRCDVIH